MNYKKGDIVVVKFPFALRNGSEIQKGRPALVISDDNEKSMPIRLAQARLVPLDSTMSVRFRKSPCRSSISLEWLFLAHCRNLPLARIAS